MNKFLKGILEWKTYVYRQCDNILVGGIFSGMGGDSSCVVSAAFFVVGHRLSSAGDYVYGMGV